jgi:hypothetical protein
MMSATRAESTEENRAVQALTTLFGLFAGIALLVYVLGGVILLLRLQTRELRAEVVVATLPREFLVSVGLAALFQFFLFLGLLLLTFVQQAVPWARWPETRGRHRRVPSRLFRALPAQEHEEERELVAGGIRGIIVVAATAALVVPLTRWIGVKGLPSWTWLVLAYTLVLVGFTFFVAFEVWSPGEKWKRLPKRWFFPTLIVGGALVTGLVTFYWFREVRWLQLVVVVLAAVLTAVGLWQLLRSVVDPPLPAPTDRSRARVQLRRTAWLTLIAFLVFVPWRAWLEVASLGGLNVAVCSGTPENHFSGLFIGENDTSVFVGESEGSFPRIVEIPRGGITRIFLGKDAKSNSCESSSTPVSPPTDSLAPG